MSSGTSSTRYRRTRFALSKPKSGWFDDDDVAWEGPMILRENAKFKYAWLPESRLEDFLASLREKYERS